MRPTVRVCVLRHGLRVWVARRRSTWSMGTTTIPTTRCRTRWRRPTRPGDRWASRSCTDSSRRWGQGAMVHANDAAPSAGAHACIRTVRADARRPFISRAIFIAAATPGRPVRAKVSGRRSASAWATRPIEAFARSSGDIAPGPVQFATSSTAGPTPTMTEPPGYVSAAVLDRALAAGGRRRCGNECATRRPGRRVATRRGSRARCFDRRGRYGIAAACPMRWSRVPTARGATAARAVVFGHIHFLRARG